MAASLPIQSTEQMLKIHTSLVDLTKSMKIFKLNPLGESQVFRNQLDQIKQEWTRLELGVNRPAMNDDRTAVVTSIDLTEKKVQKLLKKYPPQTASIAQPTQSPEAQQISKRANQTGIIAFYDDKTDALTSCFGNFYECRIEFGGIYYRNAESVIQAQKFTDQPQIMSQFQNIDGDQAVRTAHSNNMTPKRLSEWDGQKPHVNKDDVMKNAQRAKYGQNPDLKEKLRATNSAYIVEHLPDTNRRDRYWSDGFDGTGQNKLGICLMELRGEYGGTGIVHKSRFTDQFYQNCQPTNSAANYRAKCIQCKVNPKYVETSGRVHDYCGKTCAKAAGALRQ